MDFATQSRELLGSVIEIKLPRASSSYFTLCFEELSRIEKTYSRFLQTSSLSTVNQTIGRWQPVSDEFLFLLQKAQLFFRQTEGNFDITLKQTLEDLGYDAAYSFRKKSGFVHSLKQASRHLQERYYDGSDMIQIDARHKKILLHKPIEIGGFGKGFALDAVAKILDKHNIVSYYINAGGDIYAAAKKSQPPWTILLEHPDDPSRAIGTILLKNQAIAASAPNRRKWKDGHHLIDAHTKKPASGTKAIFVVANTGIEADGYATALFSAGFERAIVLAKRLPIELLIISPQNKMYTTQGFKVQFF